MKRIGFWWRVLATLIDLAFVYIVYIFSVIIAVIFQQGVSTADDLAQATRWVDLLIVAFWLVYSFCEVLAAATPGKMILRMAIGNANGTRADSSTLWLRWLTKNFSMMLLALWLITRNSGVYAIAGMANSVVALGCLMALGEMKRTWVDQWAGTAVFAKRDLIPPPPYQMPVRGVAPPT